MNTLTVSTLPPGGGLMPRTYESCHRCATVPGPEPYTPAGFDTILHCAECDRPLCEGCADTDADCAGDPPRYVGTARCSGGCRPESEAA